MQVYVLIKETNQNQVFKMMDPIKSFKHIY